jgi:hypothetical protein
MTTVTGVGPALDLDGPLPVARRFSLLKTPGIVIEEVGEDESPRWMSGIAVYGYPAGKPFTWEPCSVGTYRTKQTSADDPAQPGDRFDPFAIYFPLECSTFDARDESFIDRARLVLDKTLSHGVESALANGVDQSNNRSFGDTNLVILATNVSPRIGLSYLEDAIGFYTGRQGLIHATPAIVSAWGFGSEFTQEGGDVRDDPGEVTLRSRCGTPVISGSGYIGADPVNGDSPGPHKGWAFATGNVEVRIGDGPHVSIPESLDRSDNTVTVYPERFVVADWDTALQVGVLIDWTLSP